jgi:hypothetical protein
LEEFMRRLIASAVVLVTVMCANAFAVPVIFTLYAVTDGKLGSQTFSSSPVTMTFLGDTENVRMDTANGAILYRIDRGRASVAVTIAGNTTVAHIFSGQVYVHYDVRNAIVGFGSYAVGPDYPLTLSCSPGSTCTFQNGVQSQGYGQILDAIADMTAEPLNSPLYSAAVQGLPVTLAKPTLLTGYTHACGPGYDFTNAPPCASAPATLIHTDHGDFYLQDQAENGKGIFTVEYAPEDN